VEEINSASPGSARFYRADFASLDEVRGLAEAIRRDYDRLDVLVNNAGIFLVDDPERHLSQDGYELNFQVNYLAGYLLTDLLLPLIRESAPARIVNVASGSAAPLDFDNLMLEEGYSWNRAYGQSKLAQVIYTIDLAAEIEGSGITINALHPATFMDTNMIVGAGLQPRSSVMEGRDNVLLLINGESAGTGLFYVNGQPGRAGSAQPYDADVRAALRQASERLIGH
jgi:NAD(P)-dependent dehydrogenase (short-subunit alcohol dehydrogenase family)